MIKQNTILLMLVGVLILIFCFTAIGFAKDTGKWTYRKTADPMYDTSIVNFTLQSDSGRSVLVFSRTYKENDVIVYRVHDKEGHYVDTINEPVLSEPDKDAGYTLEPREKSERMNIWIDWGSYLGQGTYGFVHVLVRFDDEEAFSDSYFLTNNNTGTILKASTSMVKNSRIKFIEFIRKFMSHDQFIARGTPYNRNPITAVFDVRGLENAIMQYSDNLEWIK